MKPKHQRLLFYGLALMLLAGGGLLILQTFRQHLVFFYTPTDLATAQPAEDRLVRVGGLVEEGSVNAEGTVLSFTVTDKTTRLQVRYEGVPPALFREGQGVVVEGYARGKQQQFEATKLLAKHDERYMPKEVADALKESGHWQEYQDESAITKPVLLPTQTTPLQEATQP